MGEEILIHRTFSLFIDELDSVTRPRLALRKHSTLGEGMGKGLWRLFLKTSFLFCWKDHSKR
jgi:hypothetical protein